MQTEKVDGHAFELESNTAYAFSRDMNLRQFEEACYEAIDSDNQANTLTGKESVYMTLYVHPYINLMGCIQ